MKVLIIGGVAGGATAAARMRRLDERAEIVMFERGEYISFANCGLPYYIGGEITDKEELTLQTPDSFNARFNVDVRVQNEVLSINREKKTVTALDLKTGKQYEESYDFLVLSPGADPVRPPIQGIDSARVFTLRNIPDTFAIKDFMDSRKPKTAVVVGGGFIGMEMAENLHAAGLKVTIVEMADQLLAPFDYDMACSIHRRVRSKGVELLLGNAVKAITDTGKALKITLNDSLIETDMLLMSAGVKPESTLAKHAGLALNEYGYIVTDEFMRTSDSSIYAVGDAVEITDFVLQKKNTVPLAGPANKQGRIAADNICGLESRYTGTQGSAILRVFDMTAATTGLNEKTAKRLGIKYEKSFTVSGSHAGYFPGANDMTIKTLFDPENGKILGVQITGKDGVDKRCDVIAAAMRFGATASDLTRLELCYAPPYSSAKDPVNMAGYVIENILTGKVRIFHWHDVETLDKEKVTLLDVRTPEEVEIGAMPGFINIPVDSLRERMSELDPQKPVYITCAVGLRGYVASRILSQNGFEVSNLSGGYTIWNRVKHCSTKRDKS
ncbi:MAG: FAD-dependent oxidoreductase [Tannerella sp.]|jgi:NADPH-dependent 2,4-dienoyl-CoA reductase/sulfur reductase-like enzyme/rhodanese-related sulfurtransferase|nr:FAD-dependent oxidoreductase [Tannerella sp.]